MLLEANDHEGITKLLELVQNRKPTNVSIDIDLKPDECIEFIEYNKTWPYAADPSLILKTQDDFIENCNIIIHQLIMEKLNFNDYNFSLLDYGSGYGYLTKAARDLGIDCISFDPKIEDPGLTIKPDFDIDRITNFEEIDKEFDVVMLYDILDHVNKKNREKILKNIHKIVKTDGKFIVRFHPYTSRHGTHLYSDAFGKINKAYIHLVYPELNGLTTWPVIRPIGTYVRWVEEAGFKIDSREATRITPEPFFKQEWIRERLLKHWENDKKIAENPDSIYKVMSIQYVDMVLSK